MDLSTDLQAGTVPIILHLILDQITKATAAIPTALTHTTDRAIKRTTIEAWDININKDMTKETRTTKTGMITIKTEKGLTTEDNQINTSITGTNQKHKLSSNMQTRTYLK